MWQPFQEAELDLNMSVFGCHLHTRQQSIPTIPTSTDMYCMRQDNVSLSVTAMLHWIPSIPIVNDPCYFRKYILYPSQAALATTYHHQYKKCVNKE